MEYRRLGRCGLKVSEVCLGTMTFGHGTEENEAARIVGTALDAGVIFFDTADGYSNGASEVMLGRALGARRHEAIIATKVFNPMGTGPNDSGMSRRHIMNAVEGSLRRLGTDYVDLYYIHHVDVQTPLEEMLRAFDDLVRHGKIRYTACSNYEAWRLMEALWTSDSKGLARFEAYQPQYSLVVRDIEEELVPVCGLKGLGMVVWSPLAGGYLSGKYRPGERAVAGSRSAENWAFPTRYFHPQHEAILAELVAVAVTLGRSPAQVALRWVLEQPQVASAIVGARTAEQLTDSLACTGWELPQATRERLDAVSALPRRYPRSMEDGMAARRDQAVRLTQPSRA
ncbi:aldo/keto reductase [Paracraurococcus lichenis]|uniref:Aldo/keto reductase n=1 Tax=Paracraurococcus lichenis TaxID=3064888 RepID=A0ABT9E8G7_9PROT|nr:aldo/keto reductase [Paracraurococcus sp. LOR1-02]MDO9712492.1 aldo/keto reductase [Paracraurococcus sp. LOR1-02]